MARPNSHVIDVDFEIVEPGTQQVRQRPGDAGGGATSPPPPQTPSVDEGAASSASSQAPTSGGGASPPPPPPQNDNSGATTPPFQAGSNKPTRVVLWMGIAVLLALLIGFLWIGTASRDKKKDSVKTSAPATGVLATPQVVHARTGLEIPAGLEWGAAVAFIGRFCAFWDSPAAGLQWETSMDGKTWGSNMPFNYARFRAPVDTTVIFTLQDPAPPGEACKRKR